MEFNGHVYSGQTKNISYTGLEVRVRSTFNHRNEAGVLAVNGVKLAVEVVGLHRTAPLFLKTANLRVLKVEEGAAQWESMNSHLQERVA
jgi:hypothetical protein